MKTIGCPMDGGYFLKKLGCLYSIVTPSDFDISFIYPQNTDLKCFYRNRETPCHQKKLHDYLLAAGIATVFWG